MIGGLATLALPETMGKMLPDTVDQAETLRRLESVDKDPVATVNNPDGNESKYKDTKNGIGNAGFEKERDFTAF